MLGSKIFVITRAEVEQCDYSRFIGLFDPKLLSKPELAGLCGAVRLRFEHASGPEDLFLHPQARRFVRALHRAWPWVGYFLKCSPISAGSRNPEMIDVGVLVSWLYCHTDDLMLVRWDPDIVGMRFDHDQFVAIIHDILERTGQLCQRAGLSAAAARRRQRTVQASITSFFALGEQQKPKK